MPASLSSSIEPPKKICKAAADRKTKTCTAILTACRTFCLLECFEDDVLLILRNTDTGILDLKCNNFLALSRLGLPCLPVLIRFINLQLNFSFFRKLKAFESRFFKIWLRR